MGRFQREIVRWNRQINLVSRQDTLALVAALIVQCRQAWSMLAEAEIGSWRDDDPVWYFDLGSGGGLPGFVWHQLMADRFTDLHTWLVEPREKRAWFLERLNQITPKRPVEVWSARWSETPAAGVGDAAKILISLKALHLSDMEVLAGLVHAAGGAARLAGAEIVIVRFYPPNVQDIRELGDDLAFAKESVWVHGGMFSPLAQQILSPPAGQSNAAALVLSSYQGSG
jgi:hypothetical protein